MQNKGFVKVFAVLLTLVCLFYLSFSVVTNHFESKAEAIAQTEGQNAADRYLDSQGMPRDGHRTGPRPQGRHERDSGG